MDNTHGESFMGESTTTKYSLFVSDVAVEVISTIP